MEPNRYITNETHEAVKLVLVRYREKLEFRRCMDEFFCICLPVETMGAADYHLLPAQRGIMKQDGLVASRLAC